jgi:hypothetical protein
MEVGQEEVSEDVREYIPPGGEIMKQKEKEKGRPKGRIFRENRDIFNIVVNNNCSVLIME